MPEAIEQYSSQNLLEKQRRNALIAWGAWLSFVFLWLALIVAAPFSAAKGWNSFAGKLYGFFGYVCHQIPSRSYHLFDHKLAVCSRCFGFYGGFFLGFVIYPLVRAVNDTEPFRRFWLFLAVVPIGVDWSLGFFGIWENTFFSRTVTGGLLGIVCAFYIVPALAELGFFAAERQEKRLSR